MSAAGPPRTEKGEGNVTDEAIRVDVRHDGGLRVITLGPAPANIVTAAAARALADAVEAAADDPHCRLVVVRGEGEHFSYGASVDEHLPGAIDDMLPAFHESLGRVLASRVPTLAAVSGLCLGGGLEVALACSLVLCHASARLAVPEIELGVFPPAASVLLELRGGAGAVARLAVTGEKIDAAEALRMGLADYSVEGDLDEAIEALYAKRFAPKSASSLRLAHRAARAHVLRAWKERIGELERLYLDELMRTHDGVEGIRAFTEKRKPQWKDA